MRLTLGRRSSTIGAGVVLLLTTLWCVSAAVIFRPAAAVAQDPAEGDPDPEEKEDKKSGGSKAKDEAPPPEDQNMLEFYFGALGWMYSIIFLGLSFVLVALFVMNLMAARRENIVPIQLIEAFEAALNEKRYQEAYDLAKNDDSFLGRVLSAGLAKLSAGYAPAIEAMQEVGQEETMKLEHRLSYISLIGSISPMVGLLGTVDGMVDSFRVIAHSTVAPKPYELAQGISKALITTLVGLWLAIPAISVYGILRNRLQRLTLEVGVVSEQLMSRFQSVGGGKKPA